MSDTEINSKIVAPTDYMIVVDTEVLVVTAHDFDDAEEQFRLHGHDTAASEIMCLNTEHYGGVVFYDDGTGAVEARRLQRMK